MSTIVVPDLAATGVPYVGLRPYESEDEGLFRGRDDAAERIIATALSSRLMVLHAPSGAGKTSLLNARVVPRLEIHGWMSARIRPENDPANATRSAVFNQLLAPPSAEARAIQRALDALAPDEDLGIMELAERYEGLKPRHDARRHLRAPVTTAVGENENDVAETRPMFGRLLGRTIDVTRFDEHLALICGDPLRSAADISARALIAELTYVQSVRAYRELRACIERDSRDLTSFFAAWWHYVADAHSEYNLILLFDQFEELFTRFADPKVAHGQRKQQGVLSYRIRERFFEEFGELYQFARGSTPGGDAVTAHRPRALRFMISLRDEYVAQLDRVRAVTDRIEDATFHLPLLSIPEANEAIRDPAAEFGYEYERPCFDDIVDKLSQEKRFMAPAHLQIVCERLWRACTEDAAEGAPEEVRALAAKRPPRTIDWATYDALGRAEGILRRFFLELIVALPQEQQLEALEILDQLVTPTGTRNIVAMSQLVDQRLRMSTVRTQVLEVLQHSTAVRAEWRLGNRFVELTHEFLIEPLLQAIEQHGRSGSGSARFGEARRALERSSSGALRSDDRFLLSASEIDTILELEQRIGWDDAAAEVLLRSAIIRPDESDERWGDRVRAASAILERTVESTRAESGRETSPARTGDESTPVHSLVLVAQYLNHDGIDVRCRAIRALSALPSKDSVHRLVDVAVGPDKPVASRAEEELVGLDEKWREEAASRIAPLLSDATLARRAYVLLGRLTAVGTRVQLPRMGWGPRLRLARASIVRTDAPRWYKGWKDRKRWEHVQHASLGALSGSSLVVALVALVFRDDVRAAITAFLPRVVVANLIVSPLLVFSATRLSNPIYLHPDRDAGALVEIGRAAFCMALSIPLVIIARILSSVFEIGPLELAGLWLVVAATAGSVRLGTLLAFEATSGDTVTARTLQTAVGGGCGAIVAAVGLLVIGRSSIDPDLHRLLLAIGLTLTTVSFGLARGFAEPESASRLRRRTDGVHRRRGLTRAGALALSVGTALVVVVAWRSADFRSNRFVLHGAQLSEDSVLDRLQSTLVVDLGSSPSHTVDVALPSTILFRSGRDGQYKTGDSTIIEATPKLMDDRNPDYAGMVRSQLRDAHRRLRPFPTTLRAANNAFYIEVGTHDDPDFEIYAAELLRRVDGAVRFRRAKPTEMPRAILTLSTRTQKEEKTGAQVDSAFGFTDSAMHYLRINDAGAATRYLDRADSTIEQLPLKFLDATPRLLNEICWARTLLGQASEVIQYCESAARRDPSAYIIDSRGLARALTRNFTGAIEDFEFFIADSASGSSTKRDRALRREWIAQLRANTPLDVARVREQVFPPPTAR